MCLEYGLLSQIIDQKILPSHHDAPELQMELVLSLQGSLEDILFQKHSFDSIQMLDLSRMYLLL